MNDSFKYYSINPVIERLHRSKRDYQKNMLIPLCGLFMISLIILSIQLLFTTATIKFNSNKSMIYDNDRTILEESESKSLPYFSDGVKATKLFVNGKYLNFNNCKIVKDNPHMLPYSGNSSTILNLDSCEINLEYDILNYTTIMDDGYGNGSDFTGDNFGLLDDDKNLIEIAWDIFPRCIHKDTLMIEEHPDIPALIEATEVLQYPKGSYYGTVILEFIINDEGEIDDLTVLKEEPTGKGFMECAKRYIENCKIKPAEKNGLKVNTKVIINTEFCKDCPFNTRGSGDVVFKQAGDL